MQPIFRPTVRSLSTSITKFTQAQIQAHPQPRPFPPRPWHKDYNQALEEQTCLLPDGRILGFAEYGVATGTPAFFFHGAPGARYDGVGYHDSAKKLGVRIICPDRPGHGLSSMHPHRKLSDYPNDISDLAAHLRIDRYHVFGQSGGGPYAVACAYSSPKYELLNSTVVAGMGHPDMVTVKEAGWYTVIALWMHVKMPGFLSFIFRQYYDHKFLNDEEKLQKSLNRMYKMLSEEDRKAIEDPEAQPAIRAVLREAYIQGADGTIDDGRIYWGPWDFELKDVKRRVQLIYGDKDKRTPVGFGRHYQRDLPDAELWELEDCGHLTIDRYLDGVLAKVVGIELPRKEGVDDVWWKKPKESKEEVKSV